MNRKLFLLLLLLFIGLNGTPISIEEAVVIGSGNHTLAKIQEIIIGLTVKFLCRK